MWGLQARRLEISKGQKFFNQPNSFMLASDRGSFEDYRSVEQLVGEFFYPWQRYRKLKHLLAHRSPKMAEAPAFSIIGAEMDSLNISTPFNEYDVLAAVQIDDSATVASEMLNHAKTLLRELEQFQSVLAEKQQCHKVSLRVFKSDVSKEIKILEKVKPLLCYSTFTSD